MKYSRLWTALAALVLVAVSIGVWDWYVHSLQARYVHKLALLDFEQKNLGSSLQRAALDQPDLLMLYGSSEVTLTGVLNKFPTGFGVFRVGGGGTDNIIYLQELASLGSELRGKNVVISFAPGQFYFPAGVSPDYYAGYFSRLHAYETVFSPNLSLNIKQPVAQRMLDFPNTIAGDGLLRFALEKLKDGSPQSIAAYTAVFPLGLAQTFILNLQDDWEMWDFFQHEPALDPTVTRETANIDWNSLIRDAQAAAPATAANNPFGFENGYWLANGAGLTKLQGSESDAKFQDRMAASKEWLDLELLLRVIHQLGARALVISTPMPGAYYDSLGISANARRAYYDKLEALCHRYDVQVVDFAGFDETKYFVQDRWSHPSKYGGLYYQLALDRFYHGEQLTISASAPQH